MLTNAILESKPYCFVCVLLHSFLFLVDLIQNTTIEERVTLLEIQVVVIQDDVADLEVNLMELQGNVNFLFDEQVIQDERLLNLEEASNDVDDQLDLINGELQSKFVKFIPLLIRDPSV